ncbi:hypothetical protein SRHO_G00096310 [Serrasalmus rhombeus]
MMGDFNAKIGRGRQGEKYMGRFGLAPNARLKNEIDYILVDKRCIIQDVSVIAPFNTGSDHRLVQAKIVDEQREARALHLTSREQRVKVMNKAQLRDAIVNERWDLRQGIDEDYDSLVQKLKECLRKAKVSSPKEPCGRISEGTKKMMEKWRNMKHDGSDLVEYSIL